MDHVNALEPTRLVSTMKVSDIADLALRHKSGVSRLLASREDLRGVHAFADVLEEAVRWSA